MCSVASKTSPNRKKIIALWVVGILTLLYVVAELALAMATGSLVLLSDGFHNLSDVVSIGIAFWAIVKAESGATDTMSFGWKRTEVVGALVNGCSLLALCLYIVLEAIPRFFKPEQLDGSIAFISVAGAGVLINLIGTIVFWATGTHAHAHAHDEEGPIDIEDHAHHDHAHEHHDHGEKKDKKKNKKEKHLHDHADHAHGDHAHEHDHDHEHGDHAHPHAPESSINQHQDDFMQAMSGSPVLGDKQKQKKKDGHKHDAHKHDDYHKHDEEQVRLDLGEHDHHHGHDDHDHDHHHSHGHSHGGHDHGHDMNMWAVFIHYLGDAVSSLFVLATGLLIHFFPTAKWTHYLDPSASLLIVAIMLWTTIPLVLQCARILLQRVPSHVDLAKVRAKMLQIDGVQNVHDLHVWCLVDGMTICTVHVTLDSPESFDPALKKIRKIFHKVGIHSSTIQPEYLKPIETATSKEMAIMSGKRRQLAASCEQNCTPDCKEDWCCKSPPQPAVATKRRNHGATDFDPVFNPREDVVPPRIQPPPADAPGPRGADLV